MCHGPVSFKISSRYNSTETHPRDALKSIQVPPCRSMNRSIIVLVLNDGHSCVSNRKSPIVRRDSLSCSSYPCQDVFRLKGRVLQLNIDLNLSSTDVQHVSRVTPFHLADRRAAHRIQ